MPRDAHAKAQLETQAYLAANGISDQMVYGPISDRYWNELVRIVVVNLETWGYNGCGRVMVNRDVLSKWIADRSTNGSRTASYTYAFLNVLIAQLSGKSLADGTAFRAAYLDQSRLLDTMERTTYYNVRYDSNHRKAQDFRAIAAASLSEVGRLVRAELIALDPHIVIASGRAGLISLNMLMAPGKAIVFRQGAVNPQGIFLQSLGHFSRANYREWVRAVNGICDWAQKAPFAVKA